MNIYTKFVFPCFVILIITSCFYKPIKYIREQLKGNAIHEIEFTDDKTGYAIGYGSGNLYKTSNGGETWLLRHQFDSTYFEQMQFFGKKNGWLIGSPNKVYFTQDGGKHWQDKSIPEEEGNYIYGMYFKSINEGTIAVFNSEGTRIYKTNDTGNSWQLVNTTNETIIKLQFAEGKLYGLGKYVIIENIDQKEACRTILKKKVGQIRSLCILNNNKMIAVSMSGFILINHYGKRWTELKYEGSRFREILKLNEDSVIIVGDNNECYHNNLLFSEDKGNRWRCLDNDFSDIHDATLIKDKVVFGTKSGIYSVRKEVINLIDYLREKERKE